MDIRDLLSLDHREALQLARLAGHSADAACRVAALRRLASLVQSHAQAEEGVVHAALRAADLASEATTQHARLEHALVAHFVHQLQQVHEHDDRWHARCDDLLALMSRHVEEEEAELFPRLEARFSCTERHALATHFLAQRRASAWSEPPAHGMPQAVVASRRASSLSERVV